ncbi:MAG: DsrE family protein [Bacteroidales bacterium]|nr:DsrE family protein [Bacteroidales bacterium]
MKNILIITVFVFYIFSCSRDKQNMIQSSSEDSVTDGIFIHITESYNNPHKVLMALKMADIMSVDKDVLVYIDILGAEWVINGSKDITHNEFESAHTYLRRLIEKRVGIYVCPTCLKAAGFSDADLIEGLQIANKERFFDFTDGKIITIDY